MTFSMRQLFALIFVIGPAFGFALSYGRLGIWLCVFYVAITLCLLFLVHRTLKTWRTENVPRRVYGITLSTLCFGLWLLLLANIGTNPTIHRSRVAANLQSTLRLNDRFGSVHVEYIELRPKFLRVTGILKTEEDFALLRKKISDCDWWNMDGVWWRVTIQSTHRDLDEWDSDLKHL